MAVKGKISFHLYHLYLLLLHVAAVLAFVVPANMRWWIASLAIYAFLQVAGANIALHRFFSHGTVPPTTIGTQHTATERTDNTYSKIKTNKSNRNYSIKTYSIKN